MSLENILKKFENGIYESSLELFKFLNVPINEVAESDIDIKDVFGENINFQYISKTYLIGSIDDEIFKGNKTQIDLENQKYEGILIFGVELNEDNPQRYILSSITRTFNQKFPYFPIIVVFKYNDKISIANTQRESYKIDKVGEKIVKVTILRDIDINNPHSGHLKILEQMNIKKSKKEISTFEELYNYYQEVFDIELLQENFYQQLFIIFENLINTLKYPDNDFNKKQNFIVRLIGRLLFLKFLEKKGVVPTEKFQFSKDYYHFKLEPLFFEILNKPINHRNSLLLEENDKNIPFLNGGLFEPYKEDFYNESFLSSLVVSDIHLKELLELFEKYYFTIDENTSQDKEIGLDPELLGMVFENLIGYINPETQESARKQTGSFYTPREIVEYMVENSLFEYLKEINETKIKKLIFQKDSNEIEYNEKIKILDKLYNLKILDPAVGSGAFPMGILNKVVEILNLIDIDAIEWFKLQSKEFQNKHKHKDPNYIRKLAIIQNSIYGIDIQPIAIEIAKLRFFLSLLVDEDKNQIEPLPNMEFKLVCANTLLPLEKIEFPEEKQKNLLSEEDFETEYHNMINELKSIKKDYFFATFEEKANIKKEFNTKFYQLVTLIEKLDLEQSLNNTINSYQPFEVSSSAKFFDSEYMFSLSLESFDIIIGNPPYIRQEKIKELKSKIYNINKKKLAPIYQNSKHYLTYNGTADIYVYFFEKGYQLLKKNGVLTFITSNKYTRAKYGKNLRDFILSNTKILDYIDFNGVKVFKNATVDTSILTFQKTKNNINSNLGVNIGGEFIYCKIDENYTKEPLIKFIEKNRVIYNQKDLSIDSFSFLDKKELSIKKRIEEVGISLKEWDIKIYRGILTGFNEAFIIDENRKEKLIKEDPKSAEIIKPLLRGRDIKKYSYEFKNLYIINTHNGIKDKNIPPINIEDYPAIKKHLDKYYSKLEKRTDKGETPYNLRNCVYLDEFEKEKIIYPDIGNLTFCFDNKKTYFNNTVYFVNSNSKYLLAILNSKIIKFYYNLISSTLGNGGNRAFKIFIEKLPIPKIQKEKQKPFEILVDYIMFAKKNNLHKEATIFENVIDNMVYELYFEKEFKEKNIEIIKYTSNFKEIENLDDNEKIEVINEIYKELTNQTNPINKNIQKIKTELGDLLEPILKG